MFIIPQNEKKSVHDTNTGSCTALCTKAKKKNALRYIYILFLLLKYTNVRACVETAVYSFNLFNNFCLTCVILQFSKNIYVFAKV